MTAWGFSNGQFTPRSFAAKAKLEGYKWAALELDDETLRNPDDPSLGTIGEYNTELWDDFRIECLSHDVLPGVWVTEGAHITRTPDDALFSIAELEGPGDYDGIMLAVDNNRLPRCSLAVCTNFNVPLTDPNGVPRPEKAKPLIDAGFACLTECYLGDNPNATPDEMDFKARQCGWPTSQPVFGVYNKPPSAYAKWAGWPGVDYLGENVL